MSGVSTDVQEYQEVPLDEGYREDQFYLGINFNLLLNFPQDASQNSLSYGLQGGFIRDIPLNEACTFALGIGVGYGFNSYYSNLRALEGEDGISYEILSDPDTYKRNKIETHLIEVPLEFRPRVTDKSKFDTLEMLATFKLAIILAIKGKQRFFKFAVVGFIGFLVNWIGIEVFRLMPFTENLASHFQKYNGTPFMMILATASSWSAAFGAELSIISNFTLNNIWTFKEKKISKFKDLIISFLKFNFTSFGAVLIQFAVIGFSVNIFGDTGLVRLLALVFAIGFIIIPYNYTMYNLFIWKTWKLNKIFSNKKE